MVYDNHFTTVSSDYDQDNVPVPPNFHNLFRFSREQHYDLNDLNEASRRQNNYVREELQATEKVLNTIANLPMNLIHLFQREKENLFQLCLYKNNKRSSGMEFKRMRYNKNH